MSSVTVTFLNQISRFSILYALAAPIYVFATEEYKDPPKLALAILILIVIITTLNYWNKPEKKYKWMIADRLIAVAIIIVAFIYGNNESKAFLGASVYFYLLGRSGEFKNYNSFINHTAFRFFAGVAILIYLADSELWNPIFLTTNILFVIAIIFVNVNNVKQDKFHNRREQILDSILIF